MTRPDPTEISLVDTESPVRIEALLETLLETLLDALRSAPSIRGHFWQTRT